MSDQQQNLCSDSNFWKKAKRFFEDEIAIKIDKNDTWFWVCKGYIRFYRRNGFKSAADAEQNLITFLKNYEGFRNG